MSQQNIGESSITQQASQVNSSSELSNEVNKLVDRIDRISAGSSAFKEQVPHVVSINARNWNSNLIVCKTSCLQKPMRHFLPACF